MTGAIAAWSVRHRRLVVGLVAGLALVGLGVRCTQQTTSVAEGRDTLVIGTMSEPLTLAGMYATNSTAQNLSALIVPPPVLPLSVTALVSVNGVPAVVESERTPEVVAAPRAMAPLPSANEFVMRNVPLAIETPPEKLFEPLSTHRPASVLVIASVLVPAVSCTLPAMLFAAVELPARFSTIGPAAFDEIAPRMNS